MVPFRYSAACLAILLGLATTTTPALARGNDLVLKTGKGEELVIKNGFFGGKEKVVKDRFGNKYESKKGWFGTKKTDATVLGNSYQSKKGLFGGTDVSGSTILGDSVRTKKGIFGRRTTEVDVSGVTSLVEGFINKRMTPRNPGLSALGGGSQPGPNAGLNSNQNFDLDSFDLNKGLPQDFGQAPGGIPDANSLPEVPPRAAGAQF